MVQDKKAYGKTKKVQCINMALYNTDFTVHKENMSMKCLPSYTPLLYSKTRECRGIHIFLIFTPKQIVGTS